MKTMIKKLVILVVLLFAAASVVACNGLTLPTNLTTPDLTTTTPGGSNPTTTTTDEPDSTTTTTTVVTLNPIIETQAINAMLEQMEMEVPPGFAGALVEKGMGSAEFADFIAAFMNFMATVGATQDPAVINTALKAFLVGDYNYEALLAGAMLMVPEEMDKEIYYMNQEIAALDPQSEYYQEDLASLQTEIAMLQTLKTAIANNEEEMLEVAVNTLDYLIAFQADIDNELLMDVIALGSGSVTSVAEILIIKNEIVAVLEENLPSVDDLVLVEELMISFEVAMVGETAFTTQLGLTATQSATATLLSMQLILDFIGAVDEADVNAVMAIVGTATEEALLVRNLILFVADYLEAFLVDEATLVAQLNAVYTEEQKEALVNSMITSLVSFATFAGAPEDVLAIVTFVSTHLTYDLIMGVESVVAELAMNLFTYFRTSEGILVELILEENGYYSIYSVDSEVFGNKYLDVVYDNYTLYNLAEEQTTVKLIDELLNYANAVASDMSAEDVDAFVNLIVTMMPVEIVATETGLTQEQVSALIALFDQAITDQSGNALMFLNALIDYMITNDVITGVGTMRAAVAAYYTALYGVNFKEAQGYFDDTSEYDMITSVLFGCKQLDLFLTETNLAYLNAVSAEIFDVLDDPNMLLVTGMTVEQVNGMKDQINQAGAAFRQYVTIIKDFPAYESLSPEQKTTIFEFVALIDSISAKSN